MLIVDLLLVLIPFVEATSLQVLVKQNLELPFNFDKPNFVSHLLNNNTVSSIGPLEFNLVDHGTDMCYDFVVCIEDAKDCASLESLMKVFENNCVSGSHVLVAAVQRDIIHGWVYASTPIVDCSLVNWGKSLNSGLIGSCVKFSGWLVPKVVKNVIGNVMSKLIQTQSLEEFVIKDAAIYQSLSQGQKTVLVKSQLAEEFDSKSFTSMVISNLLEETKVSIHVVPENGYLFDYVVALEDAQELKKQISIDSLFQLMHDNCLLGSKVLIIGFVRNDDQWSYSMSPIIDCRLVSLGKYWATDSFLSGFVKMGASVGNWMVPSVVKNSLVSNFLPQLTVHQEYLSRRSDIDGETNETVGSDVESIQEIDYENVDEKQEMNENDGNEEFTKAREDDTIQGIEGKDENNVANKDESEKKIDDETSTSSNFASKETWIFGTTIIVVIIAMIHLRKK